MDRQNVVSTHIGILFISLKEEGTSDTCSNMDEPWRPYAETSQSPRDKYCDSTYMQSLKWPPSQRQRVDSGCQGLGKKGVGQLVFNRDKASVWEAENILEMGQWCWPNILNVHWTVHLTHGKMIKIMSYFTTVRHTQQRRPNLHCPVTQSLTQWKSGEDDG